MNTEERGNLVEMVESLRSMLAMHYGVYLEDKGVYILLTVDSGSIGGLVRAYCPAGLKVTTSAGKDETVLVCRID
jgi:hypothetical protein